MALVSEDYNFIFIHIPKCGGSSLRKMLAAIGVEVVGGHSDAADTRAYYVAQGREAFWDGAFKFSFVRDPFDWMVSLYFYIKRAPGHWMHSWVQGSFGAFVHRYFEEAFEKNLIPFSNKNQTQSAMILDADDNLLVNVVGHVESFNVDAAAILRHILPYPPPAIVSENVSPQRSRDYRQYYDASLRALLEDKLARDFKNFNYAW